MRTTLTESRRFVRTQLADDLVRIVEAGMKSVVCATNEMLQSTSLVELLHHFVGLEANARNDDEHDDGNDCADTRRNGTESGSST